MPLRRSSWFFRLGVPSVVAASLVTSSVIIEDLEPVQAEQTRQVQIAYIAPVDGPVIDRFRPPAHLYGSGNRGLDYRTTPGDPVRASADGQVIFAGQVGGTLHVTILHADGLRTSYSFVASLAVRVGVSVHAGDVIATSGDVFHFGVRDVDDTYLDPELLLSGGLSRMQARLIPGVEEGLDALVLAERRSLLSIVYSEGSRLLGGVAAAASEKWRIAMHYAVSFNPAERAGRAADAAIEWFESQFDCTPEGLSAPVPDERRAVILVGGLGSSSDNAAITKLDTEELGYEPEDVVRFSYAGGRIPSDGLASAGGPFATMTTTTYDSADTQVDMYLSAVRLADAIEEMADLDPGVPIDIVAHSQGGVVSRLALDELARRGRIPETVENVVTIGSPHQGSDVATAVAAGRTGPRGTYALEGVRTVLDATLGLGLDPGSESISQMAETSELQRDTASRPLPAGVRFTSIGARGDMTVPAPRTRLDGASSYIVQLDGPTAHDSLPGAAETTTQVGLAIAGMPPSCVGARRAARDFVVGESVSGMEDSIGALAMTAEAMGTLPGVPSWPGMALVPGLP